MSVFAKESIQAIADTAGISLKDDVASALVQDVEYRLREIIHEAGKFMRHSKRQKLHSDDINYALRVRNVEPLYGWSSGRSAKFNLITQGTQQIYYVEDQELDLEDILNGPLPPVPLDVTYTAHWLAIEGVQPAIVQNPTPSELRERNLQTVTTTRTLAAPSSISASIGGQPSTETLVKTVLTKELQGYYEKVTEAVVSTSEELKTMAIESVSTDPGIQPLLPYLIQFIAEQVTQNIRRLNITFAMMRLTRAILRNSNLFVEPYLHQLIPNILTCVVAKRLCEDPAIDDHWALRSYAAQLISHICANYGTTYQSLQPRVTKTLLRAFLDPQKSLSTNYGAIVGLGALGPEVVKILIIPNVKAFTEKISEDLQTMEDEGPRAVKKMEAEKCRTALARVVADFVRLDLEERRRNGQSAIEGDELRQQLDSEFGTLLVDNIWHELFPSSNGTA